MSDEKVLDEDFDEELPGAEEFGEGDPQDVVDEELEHDEDDFGDDEDGDA